MVEDSDSVVDGFANRLKFEFEDRDSRGDGDEDQDWFVNDKRELERAPSPTRSDRGCVESAGAVSAAPSPAPSPIVKAVIKAALPSPVKKSNSAPTVESDVGEDFAFSGCKTAFLHYFPPAVGILVMEVGHSELVSDKRYGSKYFKIYLPLVNEAQTEFCLFARKRLAKSKFRFSLSEESMPKWSDNPYYDGKVTMTATGGSKKFKLSVPKNATRVQFDIDQRERKQELTIRLNAQTKGFNFFRGRASSEDSCGSEYKSLLQKFINPIADARCPRTNETLFKMEKEGDVGYEKYIVTYAKPFSLFVSCCIAVGIEGHLLE